MIYLWVAVILFIGFFDGRGLVRDRQWGEAAAYISLLIFGTSILVMNSVAYRHFHFVDLISYVFSPYFKAVSSVFLRF
ncbi:MAG: hypothetical protein ACM3UZ_01080 [Acidobacteriota bacterium]